jgi:hypothetical protein
MTQHETRHLDEFALDELLIDPAATQNSAAAHLQQCAQCRAKFDQMAGNIKLLREGVVAWGEGSPLPPLPAPSPRRWQPRWAFALEAVAATALIVAAWGTHVHSQRPPQAASQTFPAMQQPAKQVSSDAALLDQVDQQLAEGEPSAMAPLTELIQTQDAHPKENKN